jgi:methyl-accepting chemotaxis protein
MLTVISAFLITMLPLTAILGLLTFADGIAVLIVCLVILFSLGLLIARRVQLAGYCLIAGIIGALWVRSWLANNTDLSGLLFNYFAVTGAIVLSGLIIHEFAPFVVAGVIISGFSLVFWQNGVANSGLAPTLIQIFVFGAALHLIMAAMSSVNARLINRAMNRMRWQNDELLAVNRRLEKNISLNTSVGDTITQLASDLLYISQDQTNRAQSQTQSVMIVTSTLEQLSATARQVAEVADNVYLATEQALHTAETGGKAVGFGIDSIATLTGQVETISKIANELGSKSRRISEIVETITELAEETNLLALNATIEAAGAGEYGRRFAVVAQEVQFLATRSRAASRDVQSILGQIRTSINNTLKATDEGLTEAQRMSEVASQAGEALEQIIENVEGTTYLARQINLTTQQQRTATDQAVEMIRQVAGNSRETTTRSQQLLLASDRLSQTAASLRLDQPGNNKAET